METFYRRIGQISASVILMFVAFEPLIAIAVLIPDEMLFAHQFRFGCLLAILLMWMVFAIALIPWKVWNV